VEPFVMASKTLIFIPTYNESGNVTRICEEILALGLDADVLFLDDNSPDGTGSILDDLAEKHPRVSVIHRAGKLGIGGAHLDGIAYAYDHGYQILVTMDCDFTHSPSDIPVLLERGRDTAITLGSRFLEKGSLPGWSLLRKSLTVLGHSVTQSLLGISHDATGAFRVYRLDAIPRAMFDLVSSRGYSFFFESLFVANQNGITITEVPIVLPARTYGESKMRFKDVQASVRQLVSLGMAAKLRPARFRIGQAALEIDDKLHDPQGWDSYWMAKQNHTALAYEAIATLYRNIVIKSRLNAVIHREFEDGANLLHAGCGSGQVDVDLHDYVNITAVDISVPALEIYRRENPKARAIKHANIFQLPFEDKSFDGVYNLGVVEHFEKDELSRAFGEFRRVLKPGGKFVIFWPHAHASSVMVLDGIHWVMNDVLKQNKRLHPPEVSLVQSERHARELLESAGFSMRSFTFGPQDLFVQAVVVAERS
jgi:dolichol-phosphate mannosyltransferase